MDVEGQVACLQSVCALQLGTTDYKVLTLLHYSSPNRYVALGKVQDSFKGIHFHF